METSIQENLDIDLVVMGNTTWFHRIAQWVQDLLARRTLQVGQILFCQSVYEAVATAIELRRRERVVKVCIMVDYLPSREMKVFHTLSRLSRVSSIAFSGSSQWKKLVQARQLGADDLLGPTGEVDLNTVLREASNDMDTSSPALPARGPEPVTGIDRDPRTGQTLPTADSHEEAPLLSREEIDALLNGTW